MFVRFTAAGLVGLSLLEMGLYAADCLAHHQPIQALHGMSLALPFFLGVVILVRARTIAGWLADKFD